MNKIILTGHGHFASGLESSIQMLAGSNPDIYVADFLEEESDKELKDKITSIIDKDKEANFLIFCDMAGGTPFNVAAKIASENHKIEVVAGGNLSAIIEILFTKDEVPISDLANKVVEITKVSTLRFVQMNQVDMEDVDGEGI